MSEWGRVVFYYDYEKEIPGFGTEESVTRRYRGMISKAYKYPGIMGVIVHAVDGVEYFVRRMGERHYDIDGTRHYLGTGFTDDLPELIEAFDVLWKDGSVQVGIDSVEDTVKKLFDGEEIKDLNYELFACEGTDGFCYITFTGNPRDGYEKKFGYYCGYATVEDKLIDARTAARIYWEHYGLSDEEIEEKLKNEWYDEFEKEYTLFESEDEFWAVEDLGVDWIRELAEDYSRRGTRI